MPKAIEDIWLGFKLCLSVLCLLRLVLKAGAAGRLDPDELTVQGIADATGMTERQVYNALDKDRGVFFSSITFFADDLSLSIKEENTDSHIDRPKSKKRNGETGTYQDKVFSLHPAPVAIQHIIRHVVTAKGKQKLFPNIDPNKLAEADPDLVKAAGLNDPAALDMLQKHLAYPEGNAKALQALADWITEARFRLSNLAPDPLPELPDSKPITNGKRYRAAIVARRALLKHDGGALSYKRIATDTKISERSIPDLCALSGVGFTENCTDVSIDDVSQLPDEGSYSFELQAAPVKMRIVDSDGVIAVRPYDKTLAAERKVNGEHVIAIYRGAGTPFQRSQAEHEQAMLDREAQRKARAERNKDKPKPQGKKPAGSGQPRNDTPGYSESFARVWRSRLVDYIAPGAPDELLIMLVGSDTAQVIDIEAGFNNPANTRHIDGGTLINFPAPAPIAQPAEPAPIQLGFFSKSRSTGEMYTPREDLEQIFENKKRQDTTPLHAHESQAVQDLQHWLDLKARDELLADDFITYELKLDPARYGAMIEARETA